MPTAHDKSAPDFLTPDEQAQEADAREWRQVSEDDVEETKLTFDTMNEPWIGTYLGSRIVENDNGKFTQYRFEKDGFRYFTNANFNLHQAMVKVPTGRQVRITWISERDTGQQTPMRIFRVDVKR
jgi:hypothetical protein